MTVFADSSFWYAAVYARDRNNARAKDLLRDLSDLATTDHVVVETWLLLQRRSHQSAADQFWGSVRRGAARVEIVKDTDLDRAWSIGLAFPDQRFSIVDRSSFAVMERLGISRVASFDDDFVVYRYGRRRELSFEVLR